MRVEVHANGIPITNAIIGWVQERLQAALGQHASAMDRVHVQLRDLNGPRGGRDDMECDIVVRLSHGGTVVIKERRCDLYSAISTAAERLKNTVGRRLAKRRWRRTRIDA